MKKNTVSTIALLGVCSAVLLGTVQNSFGQNPGFVKADGGGNWTKDLDLREFFGVPLDRDSKVSLDPGLRFGLGGGYQFTDWFALEGELGIYENRIDSITGASSLHDAYFGNAPFLVNAKLLLPTHCPLSPYLGAGVGFSTSFFSIDHLDIGNVSLHGSAADVVFAWQAFAGLRYAINEHLMLCVEYRFFEADPASWEGEDTFGTVSDHMSFGRTETQSVSFAVNYHF
jgi:opacity protein-like surface antigen